MNKKVMSLLVIAVFCTGVTVSAKVNSFSECLRDCSEYFTQQTVSVSSANITTRREILGLDENNLCRYRETISSQNSVYTVNCGFNKEQRTSLSKIMDDFDNDKSNENLDVNDFSQVQNSKVYEEWSNYLQDTSICQIKMAE